MNLLADALEPYLRASGIQFTRNTPQMTAASSIRASNAGKYDLHLALHSNAAPEGRTGQIRGIDVYYAPTSQRGQRAANIITDNLKDVYPNPNRVRSLPTTSIGEVRQPVAPSAFLEIGYHDNEEDANWLQDNMDAIARDIALSLTEYFNIPFVWPAAPRKGTVAVSSGTLNIRSGPSRNASVIANAHNGDQLTILGEVGEWYAVQYGDTYGFANKAYIR